MFPTFERIKLLAKKQGLSLNQLEEKLGLGRNTLYGLKNKKPNAERIAEIADYFNVSCRLSVPDLTGYNRMKSP